MPSRKANWNQFATQLILIIIWIKWFMAKFGKWTSIFILCVNFFVTRYEPEINQAALVLKRVLLGDDQRPI
jgi:hypothetical protein